MPLTAVSTALALGSGGLVGLVLGLVGGGGSILAVPLLIYLVGVPSPHIAIGTAAVAVVLNAAVSLAAHTRLGTVKWRCAAVFSAAGIAGAALGAEAGKSLDGERLLAGFGGVMIVVALLMLRGRGEGGDPAVRLTALSAATLVPWLIGTGAGVGLLSGFFGIGGGFQIVPALMLATGMPIGNATGTSLVAVTAFGLTTSGSYAAAGLVDWSVAGLLLAGGAAGSLLGSQAAQWLAPRKGLLTRIFAVSVLAVGVTVIWRGW